MLKEKVGRLKSRMEEKNSEAKTIYEIVEEMG